MGAQGAVVKAWVRFPRRGSRHGPVALQQANLMDT